jgi:two-component system, chemotaxis family, chemotaxis protein CheY
VTTSPRRALVVDDSRAMRMILRRILVDVGFEVVEAGNGREALSALRTQPAISLVLVDWHMPEMDGLELVKAVRAEAAFDATILMMVTTENDVAKMTTALEAGANEYVMKPFDREVIAGKLALLGIGNPA